MNFQYQNQNLLGCASPLPLKTPRAAGEDFIRGCRVWLFYRETALHGYEKAVAFTFDPRHLHLLDLQFCRSSFFLFPCIGKGEQLKLFRVLGFDFMHQRAKGD